MTYDFKTGDTVTLTEEHGSIIPAGTYRVSKVNDDGSFHVGGNTSVWPRRLTCKDSCNA